MWDVRAEAHQGGSGWGDTAQLFVVANPMMKKNCNIKYIVAFGGHWLIILHTTINQKQMPVTGESMERMCDWVVGAGKVQ
jgi:hypothetical protein